MTVFAMGFIFIMIFTLFVGIGAAIFISFDATASDTPSATVTPAASLYDIVRHINTNTIETVDGNGIVQRWQRTTD